MSRTTKDCGRHSGIRANEASNIRPMKKIRAAARQAGQDAGSAAVQPLKRTLKKIPDMVQEPCEQVEQDGRVLDRFTNIAKAALATLDENGRSKD